MALTKNTPTKSNDDDSDDMSDFIEDGDQYEDDGS